MIKIFFILILIDSVGSLVLAIDSKSVIKRIFFCFLAVLGITFAAAILVYYINLFRFMYPVITI